MLAARGALLEQEARVAGAAAAQAALERKLGLLEAHQREVHEALGSMEAAAAAAYADELRPAMLGGNDRDAAQRDALYERAEAIAAALARAGDDLRGAIADVNASAAVASGAAASVVSSSAPSSSSSSALALSNASDTAADPCSSSSSAPLPKLVKVLNNQLHALSSLDEKCEQLEARLRALPGAAAVAAAAAAQAAARGGDGGQYGYGFA